jgi:hypothetical protein
MSNPSHLHERTPLYYEKPYPPLRKLSQLSETTPNNENSSQNYFEKISVVDPDLYVFGPPRSGSFHHQAKIVRKPY